MISQQVQRWLVILALVIALADLGRATVWIVDDDGGPGVNFTDIQACVLAAAPGDTILVAPGTYGPTRILIDKPLRILGTGADPYEVYLLMSAPAVEVRDVTGNEPVVLANFYGSSRMEVRRCDAPVIAVDVGLAVIATESLDVRIHGMQTPVYGVPYAYALTGSRLEAVGCDFIGKGGSSSCLGPGATGSPGVSINASRAHLSDCSITGGTGGSVTCSNPFYYAGDGGSGLSMVQSSLIFTGAPGGVIAGGPGGGAITGFCSYVGYGGTGLWAWNSTVQYSNATIAGGPPGVPCTSSSLAGPPTYHSGTGGLFLVTPAQPRLELLGTPGAGATVTLRTHAPSGAEVILFLGRKAIVQPEVGVEIEQLCDRLRSSHVGSVPAAGELDHVLLLPAWMTPGECLFAQAQVRLPNGERFNTNSIPLLAR